MKQNPADRLIKFYFHKSMYSLYARVSQASTLGVIFWAGSAVEGPLAKLQRATSMKAHTHRVKAERVLTNVGA